MNAKIENAIKSTKNFMCKHSPEILTGVGLAGMVTSTVLAVKATPKALELIKEEEFKQSKHLNKKEIIKVAWKPYIPAIIAGSSTIACIVGANYLNLKNQASIMSAYALLDSSYKEYRNKTKEVYGDDSEIRKKVIESKFDDSVHTNPEETLFFDYQSMRFFESTFEDICRC